MNPPTTTETETEAEAEARPVLPNTKHKFVTPAFRCLLARCDLAESAAEADVPSVEEYQRRLDQLPHERHAEYFRALKATWKYLVAEHAAYRMLVKSRCYRQIGLSLNQALRLADRQHITEALIDYHVLRGTNDGGRSHARR